MKKELLLCSLVLLFSMVSKAQYFFQYFDGADTSAWNAIKIEIPPDSTNIWQIGKPQKALFDSANTFPNAIVTDTINFYPDTNRSSFTLDWDESFLWSGIGALQWSQKLDLDTGDYGILEFSIDSGVTWQNAFNNPYVYNFYGFDTLNVDTMPDGTIGFTLTDATWKDIWFCFDYWWMITNGYDLKVRYTLITDSVSSQNEGWLIDNMTSHITFIHTINEKEHNEYMLVYPNPTTDGTVNIWTKKVDGYHLIEEMQLINMEGKIVQQWSNIPTKFFINVSGYPNGIYSLRVKTNLQEQTFPLIIQNQ